MVFSQETFLEMKAALEPLAKIADEYDNDALDGPRPSQVTLGNQRFDINAELYAGRGGKTLLTLRHAMEARRVIHGKPFSEPSEEYRYAEARRLHGLVYTGGPLWDQLPQTVRDDAVKRLEESGHFKL